MMKERREAKVFGKRVTEDWALRHPQSVIYGGGGRWYLKASSKYNVAKVSK